jgi:hypothetical protein
MPRVDKLTARAENFCQVHKMSFDDIARQGIERLLDQSEAGLESTGELRRGTASGRGVRAGQKRNFSQPEIAFSLTRCKFCLHDPQTALAFLH